MSFDSLLVCVSGPSSEASSQTHQLRDFPPPPSSFTPWFNHAYPGAEVPWNRTMMHPHIFPGWLSRVCLLGVGGWVLFNSIATLVTSQPHWGETIVGGPATKISLQVVQNTWGGCCAYIGPERADALLPAMHQAGDGSATPTGGDGWRVALTRCLQGAKEPATTKASRGTVLLGLELFNDCIRGQSQR